MLYKTGVINDPLGQTHSHASSEHCFVFLDLKSVRTTCAKQLSLPAVTLGWPSGSKIQYYLSPLS